MSEQAGRRNGGRPRFHVAKAAWKSAAVCLLLSGPPAIGAAFAEGTVVFEFVEGQDFHGRVQHATFDQQGDAWLTTYRQLLKVEHGVPVVVGPGISGGPLLAVAPGGERYALLDSTRAAFGQFSVELLDLNRPGTSLAVLQPDEPPYGFGALHLGRAGNLLVGVTALEDPEGLRGDFRYTFWSSDGRRHESVVLDGRRIGIPDEEGKAILLLGDADASAYRNDGTSLWSISGSFRKGVLGRAGETAMLNPVDDIDEVHLVRSGGTPEILKLPEPVYDMAITPDGSLGAVAAGAGKIYVIELQSCPGKTCRPRLLLPLPLLATHYITALRFLNRNLLALGAIQAAGAGPFRRFYGGMVAVVETTGSLVFLNSIKLPEPATWSPSLDVTFGNQSFAAFTPVSAMFVRVH